MLKKVLVFFLCIVLLVSSLTGTSFGLVESEAVMVNLDVQASRIRLQIGIQSYEFIKSPNNLWGFDGVFVNGTKTASPMTLIPSTTAGEFFTGSGGAFDYSVLADSGNSREISFSGDNGSPWTVTYKIDSEDSLPVYHVNINGPAQATVSYRTVATDAAQKGSWLTRGVSLTDAENTEAYIDGSNPLVFGHSNAGSIDAAYVIMAVVNKHSTNRSAQVCDTYMKSGRVNDGNGLYYGYWQLRMGSGEPKSYGILFDRDLGGRVHDVCEKYYADAVDMLTVIEDIDYSPNMGDSNIANGAVKLQNPELYIPGYGVQMVETWEHNTVYPYGFINGALQTASLLRFEGLATGRDWEANYGKFIYDTMPWRSTGQIRNITYGDGSQGYGSDGVCLDEGNGEWSLPFGEVANYEYYYTGGYQVGLFWQGYAANFYNYSALTLEDPEAKELSLGLIKFVANRLLNLNTMYLNGWNAVSKTVGNASPSPSFGNPNIVTVPCWLITYYNETGDSSMLTKADTIIDWYVTPVWNETKFDKFRGTGDATFWSATSIGDALRSLFDKYERSGDAKYLEVAKDLAWVSIMWFGTATEYAGLSCVGNRGCVDYDCVGALCFEQALPVYRMVWPLLNYVSGSAYTKFYSMVSRRVSRDSWYDYEGVDLGGAVYRTHYDTESRGYQNLMFYLNKTSDRDVFTVEKLVSKVDPDISKKRDIYVGNGTLTDRTTLLYIRYLKPGTYNLTIDGVSYGIRTNAQLEAGITLTVPSNGDISVQVDNVSLDSSTPSYTYDSSTTYLSDINEYSAVTGQRTYYDTTLRFRKDLNWNGNALNIDGTTYSKGLGMNGNSSVFYNLNGAYETFKATIGIDYQAENATNPPATMNFQVLVDGIVKYESGTMDKNTVPKNITVDVTNAKMLVIRTTNNYDNEGAVTNDLGDWVNARLEGFASTAPSGTQFPIPTKVTQPTPLPATNVAYNRPVTTTSTDSGFDANTVTDGDMASYWHTSSTAAQTLTVDLGSVQTIDTVVLRQPFYFQAGAYNIQIEGSTDDANYSVIVPSKIMNFAPENYCSLTESITLTNVRYLRVKLNNYFCYGQNLSSIEAYNLSGGIVPTPTPMITVINDNHPSITYSTGFGQSKINSDCNDGDYHSSQTANDYYEYVFTGTQSRIYGAKNNYTGMADIYVDGIFASTVDLYSATSLYQQLYYDTGEMSNGNHTVRVVVKGTKNPLAVEYWVECDKIDIISDSSSTPFQIVVQNGDFELNPIDANGYYRGDWVGSPSYSWATDYEHGGAYSGKIINVSDTDNGGYAKAGNFRVAEITGGKSYTVNIWQKTDNVSASGAASYYVQFYDSNENALGTSVWSSDTIGTVDWTPSFITVTAPSDAVTMQIELRLRGSGTVWYDDLTITQDN